MNRKAFIRNLFGASMAVAIGKKLPVPAPVSTKYAIGIDPYSKPGTEGKAFVVKLEDSWYKQQEAEYLHKWMRDQEVMIWRGRPSKIMV